MSNASTTLREVQSTLRSVIQSLIDAQEGFQKIAEDLKDETIKVRFLAESLKRAEFRGDLETVLHQEGIHDIKESGTAGGTANRVWADLKSKLGGGDHALLVTLEEAEDQAVAVYRDALESKDLPLPIRQMLVSQSVHIQNSHDYVKAARDAGE